MNADMTTPYSEPVHNTFLHYLSRCRHLLQIVAAQEDASRLLYLKLTPDTFDTGFHLAVAIQFAARGVCPSAGRPVPEIPDVTSVGALLTFEAETRALLETIPHGDMTCEVRHTAGDTQLTQDAPDYVVRFALPNMIFHMTIAYAALRQHGLPIGKADFDGLHVY